MPSSYPPSLRLEQQFTGENVNTWGDRLNAVIGRIDGSIAGLVSVALSGTYTLVVSNSASDEAHNAILKLTGSGGTLTAPSVSKVYNIWNTCSGSAIIATGAGTTATVASGEICQVICDGSNFTKSVTTDFGSRRLTSVSNPSSDQDAATKAYVDAAAFASASGTLPGQTGNSGKFLTTDGSAASWAAPTVAQISDYATDQATKTLAATKLAIAYASALP